MSKRAPDVRLDGSMENSLSVEKEDNRDSQSWRSKAKFKASIGYVNMRRRVLTLIRFVGIAIVLAMAINMIAFYQSDALFSVHHSIGFIIYPVVGSGATIHLADVIGMAVGAIVAWFV